MDLREPVRTVPSAGCRAAPKFATGEVAVSAPPPLMMTEFVLRPNLRRRRAPALQPQRHERPAATMKGDVQILRLPVDDGLVRSDLDEMSCVSVALITPLGRRRCAQGLEDAPQRDEHAPPCSTAADRNSSSDRYDDVDRGGSRGQRGAAAQQQR